MADRPVEVHVQIVGHDFLAGTLWPHRWRGVESATFRYAPSYLAAKGSYPLDPSLPLVSGPLQTALGQKIFGAFSDCAPDSWGRNLVGRLVGNRSVAEVDHLLGARDDLRQGSLRFQDSETGAFLAERTGAVPHLPDLPRLIDLADRAERDTATEAELEELVGAGGRWGSRPKAHVADPGAGIAIAKFPSAADEWDVEAWEAVALELARRAGLDVADSTLQSVEGPSVLIVDRFDRAGENRVGYLSAAADHPGSP